MSQATNADLFLVGSYLEIVFDLLVVQQFSIKSTLNIFFFKFEERVRA